MSHSETKYYAHPYLTSNGMIGHTFYSYPCPESKKYEVLGKALNISIPKLYHNVLNDKSSTPELIEKASTLYQTLNNSTVPEQIPKIVSKPVPEHIQETKTIVSDQLIEKMDEHNSSIAKIVNEKGWEEGVNEMMRGLTYSEMRARYG